MRDSAQSVRATWRERLRAPAISPLQRRVLLALGVANLVDNYDFALLARAAADPGRARDFGDQIGSWWRASAWACCPRSCSRFSPIARAGVLLVVTILASRCARS